jgi:hypothetical protein
MPDITMCNNHECIMKETCYRYKAEPKEHGQSYAMFTGGEDCGMYWYWPKLHRNVYHVGIVPSTNDESDKNF